MIKSNFKHSSLCENTSNINTGSATDIKKLSNDPLIETVLQRLPIETQDQLNSVARLENRKVFITLLKTTINNH